MLWHLGYREIVAVDWSDAAWSRFVESSSVPRSVRPRQTFASNLISFGYQNKIESFSILLHRLQVSFYALDDQRFLDGWLAAQRGDAGKFDAIVFNYAARKQ
jgi:hypothetical protein